MNFRLSFAWGQVFSQIKLLKFPMKENTYWKFDEAYSIKENLTPTFNREGMPRLSPLSFSQERWRFCSWISLETISQEIWPFDYNETFFSNNQPCRGFGPLIIHVTRLSFWTISQSPLIVTRVFRQSFQKYGTSFLTFHP